MMKNIFQKLFHIALVLFAGTIVQAQTPNFKTLNGEILIVQKQLVPDKRVAIFNVVLKDTLNPILTIKGETNLQEGKDRVLQILKSKGIQFVDSVRVLPDVNLVDKIWALATLSTCNLRAKPDHAAEMLTQALMGTPLKVLDYSDGWYRVQTPDYYIGWMEGHGLKRFTTKEMEGWKNANRFIYNKIFGNAFDSDKRDGAIISDLLLGNLFEVVSESRGFLKIRIPDGRTGFVKKADCLSWAEWTGRKPEAQSIISVAKQLLGMPYMWGGTSTKGVDCSGLTKTSYYSQGVILARDASQQVKYGEHPDFADIKKLEPGDLLFFGRNAQRVTHVALYMKDGRYIHSSGLVRINSLDPKDDVYDDGLLKRLVASSRVLKSLNTDGIVQVKYHSWYSNVNQK